MSTESPSSLAPRRRTLLIAAAVGLPLAALTAVLGRIFVGYETEEFENGNLREMSPREASIVAAIADTLIPRGGEIGWGALDAGVVSFVDNYMATADATTRNGLRGMLHVVEHMPPFFGGGAHRFTNLSTERRLGYLESWQNSGGLRGTAFALLKLSVMMGYYSHIQVRDALGVSPICPSGESETNPIDIQTLILRSQGTAQ